MSKCFGGSGIAQGVMKECVMEADSSITRTVTSYMQEQQQYMHHYTRKLAASETMQNMLIYSILFYGKYWHYYMD